MGRVRQATVGARTAGRERWAGLLVGVGLCALAAEARASDWPPLWRVDAASATGTPAVLSQGLGLGAMGEVARRGRVRPVFVAARLGWMQASAATESWIIDHHQFVAALGAGVTTTLGVGRLWVEVGGGASGLYEVLSRHQRQRIDAAGVPGGTETSFAMGPYVFAEAGVALRVRGAVSALLAVGPTIVRTNVDGDGLWRAGGAARLGVALEF